MIISDQLGQPSKQERYKFDPDISLRKRFGDCTQTIEVYLKEDYKGEDDIEEYRNKVEKNHCEDIKSDRTTKLRARIWMH